LRTPKEKTVKVSRVLFLLLLAASTSVLQARAEPWPAKPLRMIVPVGAGSTTDIVPRAIVEQLAQQLGQPIVVENRSGAGGTIGTNAVAKADGDGYTVLAHGSAHTIAPAIYAHLPYNAARDLAAVVPLGSSATVLVVSPGRGFRTAGELVQAARVKRGSLTFSSVGIGTATHLSAERFAHSAGIEALHIPFKGGAEAMLEVIAGRVDFFFGPVGLVLPQIREGRLVALVVNGARRADALPQVPTTREAGFVDAEYPIWFGLFVPAATPREVVERLNRETLKALEAPKVRDKFAQMGLEPMAMTPKEFDAYVQQEIALNAALVKRIGIKPE
jgi:tripartite-type tricarboxylate transporter receptor subunit TctC